MSAGPFLYDDGPAPLHTGTPRAARGWLIFGVLSVVLLSVGMVGGLLFFKGSSDQATEVTGVFLAALANDDTETAYQLLCEEERARLTPDQIAGEYLGATPGEVVGADGDPVEGERIQQVQVRWADGGTSQYSVISEDGARICGTD